MDGSLVVATLSLLLSTGVAVAQLVQWRREGAILQCSATSTSTDLMIGARNVGRGSCTVAGYGVIAGHQQLPWVTDVATRYWPGAPSAEGSGLPLVLTGGTSREWSIPADELSSYLAACHIEVSTVRPYIVDGVGKVVTAGDCPVMQR